MQMPSGIYYKVTYWIFSVHRNIDVVDYIEQNILNKVTKMNLNIPRMTPNWELNLFLVA